MFFGFLPNLALWQQKRKIKNSCANAKKDFWGFFVFKLQFRHIEKKLSPYFEVATLLLLLLIFFFFFRAGWRRRRRRRRRDVLLGVVVGWCDGGVFVVGGLIEMVEEEFLFLEQQQHWLMEENSNSSSSNSLEGSLYCISPSARHGGGATQCFQTFCVLSGRHFSQWRHKGDLVSSSISSTSSSSSLFFFSFFLGLEAPAIYLHSWFFLWCLQDRLFFSFSLSSFVGVQICLFRWALKEQKNLCIQEEKCLQKLEEFFFLFLNKIGVECCTSLL